MIGVHTSSQQPFLPKTFRQTNGGQALDLLKFALKTSPGQSKYQKS